MKQNKHKTEILSLLRRNISVGQMTGYFIANLVGLTVILVGTLFYCDSRNDSSATDKYFSNNYIVISKCVEGIGFAPITFSEEEVSDLQNQPWVKKIGRFTASNFAVNGSVAMGGKELSSYLFFESVPDEFFDIKPDGWSFTPGDSQVPIILCKDYLTLYNFGFAIPQRLPQLSEEVISDIPIKLRLTGENMQYDEMQARIVGFSSRLNTVAVPQSFMDWANSHFSSRLQEQSASRLIVEIDPMASSEMKSYLEEHLIEVAGDKQDTGNISHFLSTVSTVVTINGIVICLLAIFILILSIFLLIQKNRKMLRNLILLGYHPIRVGRYYEIMVIITNVLILSFALVFTFIARPFWAKQLFQIGLGGASVAPMLTVAFSYLLVVTVFDIIIIRNHIMKICRIQGQPSGTAQPPSPQVRE